MVFNGDFCLFCLLREDCLCGNKHAAFADKQVETKCNILCQRDTSRCGGEGMSNVYALEQICLAGELKHVKWLFMWKQTCGVC